MSNVIIENKENIAIVRLSNGVTNAINLQLINNLSESLDLVSEKYQGMVLAGGDKFFCMGLDLPELLMFDRSEMTDFLDRLTDVSLKLFMLSIPTVCALSGHAVAGGCVLALTCDYRFAAYGKTKLGLNEIKLGIPVPYLADLILRQIVGDRAATEMLYGGEFLSVSEAKDIGLIDEVIAEKSVEEKAIEKITELTAHSNSAFSAIKASRVEAIHLSYEKNNKLKNEIFVNCWFSEPVQELLNEASRKF